MFHIYICDDDDRIRNQIRDEIEKKILIEAYDMTVVCCCRKPGDLLSALRQNTQKQNLYFLDVELKDGVYDGFLLGKEIRGLDPHGTLVYITGFQNLAYRTFQYHLEAFDYIVKDPQSQADSIGKCLESVYLRLQQETQADIAQIYSVKIGDLVRHIPLKDIICFDTSQKPHHIILHTCSSRMDFVGNLNEIAMQLGDAFIRTHRSYLVAADKIEAVDLKHHTVKAGHVQCLVSRKMKPQLLAAVQAFHTPENTHI